MESALDLRAATGQGRSVTTGGDGLRPIKAAAGADGPAGGSPESQLVGAAQAGDRAAFGRLYDLYARMVHGILLAWVPHIEVDDLVQDVFLQAMRRLETLRDADAFGAWLARIARNRASDFHRSRPLTEELPESLPGPHRPAAEALAALGAIQSLPEAYRETLMLRLVEGMTGPEIALRTGMTPESVRVNLHRGMTKLRERLGKRGAHE